jgi:hypothetical protein
MTVLVLGRREDDHARHVLEALAARGVDAEPLDSRSFPGWTRLALDPALGTGTLQLPTGRRLEWNAIQAVYWRSYDGIEPPALPHAEQAFVAANDARSLWESWLTLLPARWVNGWQAFQWHQTKPVQFARVAQLGVPVPATLLGNDPEAVREFVAKHPQCIFKPVQGGAHTQRMVPKLLTDEALSRLQFAPVTLQEEAPGTNIRVFVAGERVLACEIRTPALDYRDDADPEIVTHELPHDFKAICRETARALDLLWTGIDFRLSPEGRYVFLEANPSPMFLGFEERTGLPLTESLIDLLTAEVS